MDPFLHAIVQTPTIAFTVLVGISLVYWLFVIIGAVGIDMLDGATEGAAGGIKGGAEGIAGALKGAGDAVGSLKGAADAAAGAVKGAGEAAAGAVKGAGEAGAKAAGEAMGKSGFDGGLLAALGLVRVPITVSGSLIFFWGWCSSLLLMNSVAPQLSSLPAIVIKSLILLVSLLVGTLAASVTARPMHKVFNTNEAPTRNANMGKVCTVTSGRVDGKFGTARMEDGGAGLILNIFCSKDNQLKKGDQALVLDYDGSKNAYEVEPVDWLLPEEVQAISDPNRAAVIAQARIKAR